MNIKILGGGSGTYANKGSSTPLVNYLQHEDLVRLQAGQTIEPFFDQKREMVSAREVIYRLDHNRAQLGKNDAKFYSMIVSPSEKELQHLGKTKEAQAKALKEYIRQELMPAYAAGFHKGLTAPDTLYFAKIHHERNQTAGREDMHAHIIVSRKDMGNKIKLSPMTNHRGTGKGAVRGGFDREAFVKTCEEAFDRHTGYSRGQKESFAYYHALKKGSVEAIRQQARAKVAQEVQQAKLAEKLKQQPEQKQRKQPKRKQTRGIRR